MDEILNIIESVSEDFPSYSLDVVCCYLLLILLYINMEIGKNRCLMLD